MLKLAKACTILEKGPHGSRYSNFDQMKPDYIRGLGDTGEYAIIGGSFDPSGTGYLHMGLEHPGLMNRFFVGLLTNKLQVRRTGGQANFQVLFSVEAGFSRDYLIQCGIRHAKTRISASNQELLPYSLVKSKTLPVIDYFFPKPVVMTLKGSSYESPCSLNRWILRHPRMVTERFDFDWSDTISLQELQVIKSK